MKAFTYFYKASSCQYPLDIIRLIKFLNTYGELHISAEEVEYYYKEYCREYLNCDWTPVINDICGDFAKYLSMKEI